MSDQATVLAEARKFIADNGPWYDRAHTDRSWSMLARIDAALAQPVSDQVRGGQLAQGQPQGATSGVTPDTEADRSTTPKPMNETQLLVGSNELAPAIDDTFLRDGKWKPLALAFVKAAINIRDAQWRAVLKKST